MLIFSVSHLSMKVHQMLSVKRWHADVLSYVVLFATILFMW